MTHTDQIIHWLKSELQVEIEHHFYARRVGEKTSYWVLKPSQPVGSLIFLHGAGNDALFPQFILFAKLLALGFEIYTFDLDGHGVLSTSQWVSLEVLSGSSDVIRHIQTTHRPRGPVHLMGYSLGALLSLAQEERQKLASMILISLPTEVEISISVLWHEAKFVVKPSFLQEARKHGFFFMLPAFSLFKRSQFPMRFQGSQILKITSFISQVSRSLEGRTFESPVLWIYGDEDKISPADLGQKLAHHSKGYDFLRLKGENHYSILMSEKTHQAIIHWLSNF